MAGRRRASGTSACFWPGCPKAVPVSRLGCRPHWYALPKVLREQIWAHYRPGQDAASCTPEYRDALRAVLAYAYERNAEAAREAGRAKEMQRCREGLW
jgi:hypothetical protein